MLNTESTSKENKEENKKDVLAALRATFAKKKTLKKSEEDDIQEGRWNIELNWWKVVLVMLILISILSVAYNWLEHIYNARVHGSELDRVFSIFLDIFSPLVWAIMLTYFLVFVLSFGLVTYLIYVFLIRMIASENLSDEFVSGSAPFYAVLLSIALPIIIFVLINKSVIYIEILLFVVLLSLNILLSIVKLFEKDTE
ncbi:MAG: hypothetical protein FWH43_04985 [Endomicrobia bacterium]|nr:hypothetical protein [Endomicrobiia bacterium]